MSKPKISRSVWHFETFVRPNESEIAHTFTNAKTESERGVFNVRKEDQKMRMCLNVTADRFGTFIRRFALSFASVLATRKPSCL